MEIILFLRIKNLKSFSIPISQIRQHLFCPRIPYYQILLGINPPRPIWTSQGNEYQTKQILNQKRRKLIRFDLQNGLEKYQEYLYSEKLEIHGISDLIIISDTEVVPIEIKLESSKILTGHVLQLLAYGYCAEEKYGKKFQKGFIMHGKKAKVIEINPDEEWNQKLLNMIREIQTNLKEMILPDSPAKIEKCIQCEYLSKCNDRDI